MAESKFKSLCAERNLTAKMIEEITGLSKRTIYSYFQGSRTPSSTTRKLLRDKLGIDTSKIFD